MAEIRAGVLTTYMSPQSQVQLEGSLEHSTGPRGSLNTFAHVCSICIHLFVYVWKLEINTSVLLSGILFFETDSH